MEKGREFLLNLLLFLCCARIFAAKPSRSESPPLLNSPLPSILSKAVYRGAKCLVRSALLLVILQYPPPSYKARITQLNSTVFAFQSLSPSSKHKQLAELRTSMAETFTTPTRVVCIWRSSRLNQKCRKMARIWSVLYSWAALRSGFSFFLPGFRSYSFICLITACCFLQLCRKNLTPPSDYLN